MRRPFFQAPLGTCISRSIPSKRDVLILRLVIRDVWSTALSSPGDAGLAGCGIGFLQYPLLLLIVQDDRQECSMRLPQNGKQGEVVYLSCEKILPDLHGAGDALL